MANRTFGLNGMIFASFTCDRVRRIAFSGVSRWRKGIGPAQFRAWLEAHRIAVLNVAGPRESERPGVCAAAVRCLDTLLRAVARSA